MAHRAQDLRIRYGVWLAAAFCILLLFSGRVFAEEKEAGEQAEWTVMMYFCGSDLESEHDMASMNLFEMAIEAVPDLTREAFLNDIREEEVPVPDIYDKVNVVLETGGCKDWELAGDDTMPISSESLQRWDFSPDVEYDSSGYTLLEELPLKSMSDPDTLSDFIRWGEENYPAKKYALVLWDHGGGAMGLFVDELFDKDILRLDELETAMADGGVHFDTVILDACLMANLETARVLSPYASYMVASEDSSSGYGSAFGSWMSELYRNPYRDGKQLGICVCDLTLNKYMKYEHQQGHELLTYSVLDLSRVDEVVESFDKVFACIDETYTDYPQLMTYWARMIHESEWYGDEVTDMVDIGSMLYNEASVTLLPLDVRAGLQNALNDCVCYCVRGRGREGAKGLSFCLRINMDEESLDIYSRCCVSPHYLAYLDAVTSWSAPESLYETVPRLEEVDSSGKYRFDVEAVEKDGFPAAAVSIDQMTGVGPTQYYEMYFRDEEMSEKYLLLRRDECEKNYDEEKGQVVFAPENPTTGAAIDGKPCVMQMITVLGDEAFYNIPFRMDDIYNFRCGYRQGYYSENEDTRYTVYGVWNGFDDDTGMSDRNVVSVAEYQGREYRLLYPEAGEQGKDACAESDILTMPHTLKVKEMDLPAGDYAVRYIFMDVNGREIPQEMTYYHWDGNNFTIRE